jgi:tRNA(Ile)-lysidine synthase
MDPVQRTVACFLARHGVSRADRVLVAVSGGADSTGLLAVLASLGQRLAVAHVHHGLRGDPADADAAFVARRAGELGVRLYTERVRVAVGPRTRSPETRARQARYAALERLRRAAGCARVATAHTLDDQAETVLLRATRGCDLAGLSGIAPVGPRGLIRPCLGVRRAALVVYLEARGLAWCTDASNDDRAVPRNRLRAEVLPVLDAVHPGATAKLAALADAAREHRNEREARIRSRLETALVTPRDGGLWLRTELFACTAAEQRATLAAAWVRCGLRERLTRAHLDRAVSFLREGRTGRCLTLPAGYVLARERGGLWLGPRAPGATADAAAGRLAPVRRAETPHAARP